MGMWADYLISAVSYDGDRLIRSAVRHEDAGDGVGAGEEVDRMTISSEIRKGRRYCTVYSGVDTWRRGSDVRSFTVGGQPYLRTDSNRVRMDNLGDLPEPAADPAGAQAALPDPG